MSFAATFFPVVGLLVALLLSGLWIPFSIGVAALFTLFIADGWNAFQVLGFVVWGSTNSFTLSSIPLFILMAEILLHSGVTDTFYSGMSVLARRLPGGLLQTNIIGCAMFAAISGSSAATASAIGSVALPQLKERSYAPRMAYGSLAAGGMLGILIPPSIPMIIYGAFTQTSIAKLFMAGVVPGLLLTLIFCIYIAIRALIDPTIAPREPAVSFGQKLRAFYKLVPFVILIVAVIGGTYAGIMTPSEAAAIGCVFAVIISLIWGRLTWTGLRAAIDNSARLSCTILFIVLMANLFAYAAHRVGISDALAETLVSLNLSRAGFLFALFVMYALLGCVMEGIGMIVLTIPILAPALASFGIDPIWFGVFMVVQLEIGQIHPPLGMNLFIIKSVSGGKLSDVILGAIPYYFIMAGFTVLLSVMPSIATWLPSRMY